MSKFNDNYFKTDDETFAPRDITAVVAEGENILWRGKPKKSAFIAGRVLGMLPFAILWLIVDGAFITLLCMFGPKLPTPLIIGVCVFFLFHLAPIWIWITNIITANKLHKNLEYAFTDKRIIVKSGIIGIDIKNVFYADVTSVNLRVGIIDRICKTGDIYIRSISGATVISDVEDPYRLTEKLQKIVFDLKTDVAYPNELRPPVNRGFNTEYKG